MRTETRRVAETLWTVEDVAEYLVVPVQSVQEMLSEQRIPHLKIGEHLRFRRKDIDRWLDLLAVPCTGQALRPISLSGDSPVASAQHPLEAPLPVPRALPQAVAPTFRPSPASLSKATQKSHAPAPLSRERSNDQPLPAERVYTSRGYTVRVKYQQLDPADQERRLRSLAEVIAKSLLRMKREGGS